MSGPHHPTLYRAIIAGLHRLGDDVFVGAAPTDRMGVRPGH